jgi:O-antigen/teichoic acid export membrane protein
MLGRLSIKAISFGLIKLWLSWSVRIGVVILSWFWAEKMVGWYGAAYATVLGFVSISNAINGALYPTLSRQHSDAPANMPKFYLKPINLVNSVLKPVLATFVLISVLSLTHRPASFNSFSWAESVTPSRFGSYEFSTRKSTGYCST